MTGRTVSSTLRAPSLRMLDLGVLFGLIVIVLAILPH
jgi:hypothetical protein